MRIGPAGRLTTLALGGAFLLAACDDSPTDPPVTPVPMDVEVAPGEITFTEVGATETLSATVLDADGEPIPGAEVTWSSSNEGVATVTAEGVVEAIQEGVATITATSENATGTAEVVVEIEASDPIPTSIELDPEQLTLTAVGATAQISATVLDQDGEAVEGAAVAWTSSDEEVAIVDEDGLVEAVGEGSASITATHGELETVAEVTVELEG